MRWSHPCLLRCYSVYARGRTADPMRVKQVRQTGWRKAQTTWQKRRVMLEVDEVQPAVSVFKAFTW